MKKTTMTTLQPLLAVITALLLLTGKTFAKDPGGLATNDFGNNGASSVPADAYKPGTKQRKSKEYLRENPDAAARKYYEKGGKATNHDNKCRAKLAYKAATYEGPAKGYHPDGRPEAGAGKYGEFPENPDDIINHICEFVEDMFYPRLDSEAEWFDDEKLCAKVRINELDIGKPHRRDGYCCIVMAHLFTSLARELGFPARENNVMPSFGKKEWGPQTAAAGVWYDGKWHFFDPFESFKDPKNYVAGTGRADIRPGKYHDACIWARHEPPRIGDTTDYTFHKHWGVPLDAGWGRKPLIKVSTNGTEIKVKTAYLRLGVEDSHGRYAGFPIDDGGAVMSDVIYIPHDHLIQSSRLAPPGPDTKGYELVTILYPDDMPSGTYDYQAILTNPTALNYPYELELGVTSISLDLMITVTPDLVDTLEPGETRRIPFQVTINGPLNTSPPPVTDVTGSPLKGGKMTVFWSPVRDAYRYRIYRSKSMVDTIPHPDLKRIAETEETSLEVTAEQGELIFVQPVDAEEQAGELDPEGGSSTVAVPAPVEKRIWLWIIAGAAVLFLAAAVLRRRIKRR
jgi:hypothetical protein